MAHKKGTAQPATVAIPIPRLGRPTAANRHRWFQLIRQRGTAVLPGINVG